MDDFYAEMRIGEMKTNDIDNDINALKKILQRHDWYYMYSDDHDAWLAGKAESQRISNYIDDLKKRGVNNAIEIYKNYCPDGYLDNNY